MELKPCPFCGEASAIVVPTQLIKSGNEYGQSDHYIHCECCGADGPPESNEEEAIEAWNRRAEAQWQPIETAPKELGKRILGLKDCGEGTLTSISVMFWLNDGEWHINDCAPGTAEGFGYRVTHWMPLPVAPEVKHAE